MKVPRAGEGRRPQTSVTRSQLRGQVPWGGAQRSLSVCERKRTNSIPGKRCLSSGVLATSVTGGGGAAVASGCFLSNGVCSHRLSLETGLLSRGDEPPSPVLAGKGPPGAPPASRPHATLLTGPRGLPFRTRHW